MVENRCRRCNRKLSDPNALYGWRCAEILGVTEDLNNASDEVYDTYNDGIMRAYGFLMENPHLARQMDMPKFYGAVAKMELADRMRNPQLMTAAAQEGYEALGLKKAQLQPLPLNNYIELADRNSGQVFINPQTLIVNQDKRILSTEDYVKTVALREFLNYAYEKGNTYYMELAQKAIAQIRQKDQYDYMYLNVDEDGKYLDPNTYTHKDLDLSKLDIRVTEITEENISQYNPDGEEMGLAIEIAGALFSAFFGPPAIVVSQLLSTLAGFIPRNALRVGDYNIHISSDLDQWDGLYNRWAELDICIKTDGTVVTKNASCHAANVGGM